MAAMGPANGSDLRRVPGMGKPVVNGRANASAGDRRVARPVVAGDEQHDPVARADRALQPTIDRLPGGVEGHAVEIENAVRLDAPAPQALVPTAVEGSLANRFGRNRRLGLNPWQRDALSNRFRFYFRWLRV